MLASTDISTRRQEAHVDKENWTRPSHDKKTGEKQSTPHKRNERGAKTQEKHQEGWTEVASERERLPPKRKKRTDPHIVNKELISLFLHIWEKVYG